MGLRELLFGTQNIDEGELQPQYGEQIQSYLDSLENQEYFKNLLNRPNQTVLTPDQYKIGITQGLNYGVPEIAQAQQQLGIRIPQTGEDKYNASIGEFNKYPMIRTGILGGPREGGLLNDFSRGYNENYNNRFSFDNLAPQGKNWATRIGEGLGSVGRFIDSPLGRGLIAGGLNSALGYDDSFKEGLTALVGRQNAQTADRLYRKQLKDNYGYTDEDLRNITGNINKDIFNSLALSSYRTNSLKIRQDIANASDNTKRANIIMQGLNNGTITPQEAQIHMANYGITLNDLQKSNATRNAEVNEYLAPHKANAYDTGAMAGMMNAVTNKGRLGLQQEEFENELAQQNSPSEGDRVIAQLDELKNLYNKLPQNKVGNGAKKATAVGVGLASSAGLRTDDVAAYEGVANMVTNLVARKLAGEKGVMTDKDFDRAKKMVPSVYDSPQQAEAKIKAIKQLYYVKPQGGKQSGRDPLGIR